MDRLNFYSQPAAYSPTHGAGKRRAAQDMRASGCTLAEILRAGEWRRGAGPSPARGICAGARPRSPAFLAYLDMHALERDAVIAAHVAESSGDEA